MDTKSIDNDKFGEPIATVSLDKTDVNILLKFIYGMSLDKVAETRINQLKDELLDIDDKFMSLETENKE